MDDTNADEVGEKLGLSLILHDLHTFPSQGQSNMLILKGRDINASNKGEDSMNLDSYGAEDEYNADINTGYVSVEDYTDDDEYSDDDDDGYSDIDNKDDYAGTAYHIFPIEVFDYDRDSCDKSKNELVYYVWVDDGKYKNCVESLCIDMLKQAGCPRSCFIRCSKKDKVRFYAKLDDKQASSLKCVSGISGVFWEGDLFGNDD